MPKLPQIRPRQLVKALERLGFVGIRQKGSHLQMKKANLLVTVPIHPGNLNPETLESILRQSKLTGEELMRAL